MAAGEQGAWAELGHERRWPDEGYRGKRVYQYCVLLVTPGYAWRMAYVSRWSCVRQEDHQRTVCFCLAFPCLFGDDVDDRRALGCIWRLVCVAFEHWLAEAAATRAGFDQCTRRMFTRCDMHAVATTMMRDIYHSLLDFGWLVAVVPSIANLLAVHARPLGNKKGIEQNTLIDQVGPCKFGSIRPGRTFLQ